MIGNYCGVAEGRGISEYLLVGIDLLSCLKLKIIEKRIISTWAGGQNRDPIESYIECNAPGCKVCGL